MFFEFWQNNSGGSFHVDHNRGIGPRVWIEARDAAHANERALEVGLYFDGAGDCECCGNRWSEAYSDNKGSVVVDIDAKYDFKWHDTVYVHYLNGTIGRMKETPIWD